MLYTKYIKQGLKIISLSFLIGVSGVGVAEVQASKANPVSYLFIQNAKNGILQVDPQDPKQYHLVLEGVQSYVMYFSDRPKRFSGLISTERFVSLWHARQKNNFSKDAPNVAVSGMKLHRIFRNKEMSVVFSLENPVYDDKNHTVTYDADLVGDPESVLPQATKLKDVVLFFDNAMNICTDPSCCPEC